MAVAVNDTDVQATLQEYWRTREPGLEGRLVASFEGLARSLATRVAGREDGDDALQVARFALVLALRRYDPDRGVAFSTFAWATISGELKRFVRDTSWVVHVDRSLQERHLRITQVVDELRHQCGREPSLAQVAERSGCAEPLVREALGSATARRPGSIHGRADSGEQPLHDRLGREDRGFDATDDAQVVWGLLGRLPELDRALVRGYWFGGRTQVQLAEEHGLSQMQVSRILRRALGRLRQVALAQAGSQVQAL